jgi:hypothetical protein
MWKESPDNPQGKSHRHATPQSSSSSGSSSGSDIGSAHRVLVRIIRPDGSSRDVTVAGHFREEHLCSLVDDELCHLQSGETLTLHLFHPDGELAQSLRNRWQEGLSDNRQVFVREVLGPNDDPREIATQLRQIRRRMATGEKVNLAIRSPQVAEAAREELRKLLVISQKFDDALLSVWVHGDEQQQRAIVGRLEDAGMVRLQDYEQFLSQQRERRWKGPWIDFELKHVVKKPKKRSAKKETSEEAVSRWIKKVEEDRERTQH